MNILPLLFFHSCCEEVAHFYAGALGGEVSLGKDLKGGLVHHSPCGRQAPDTDAYLYPGVYLLRFFHLTGCTHH